MNVTDISEGTWCNNANLCFVTFPVLLSQARSRLTVGGRTVRRSSPGATSWCGTTTCTRGTSPSSRFPSEFVLLNGQLKPDVEVQFSEVYLESDCRPIILGFRKKKKTFESLRIWVKVLLGYSPDSSLLLFKRFSRPCLSNWSYSTVQQFLIHLQCLCFQCTKWLGFFSDCTDL